MLASRWPLNFRSTARKVRRHCPRPSARVARSVGAMSALGAVHVRRTSPSRLSDSVAGHRDRRDHRHAVDVDAGRHDRHRRAAADAGRARPVRRLQELGDHRLRADVRRPAAARRAGRRRHRAQARVHLRRRGVHARVAGLRAGHRTVDAHRGARAAGRRRRGGRTDRAGADRHDFRRRARPQSGDGGVGGHAGPRFGAGPGARRCADRHLLAAGVPDQRADRHRHHLDRGDPARRDPPRTAQTRHHRRAAGHPGLYRRRCWCSRRARRAAGSTRG